MKTRIQQLFLVLFLLSALGVSARSQDKRTLKVDDIFQIKQVRDPQISPQGRWVAYTVSHMEREKDRSDSDIYMSPLRGGEAIRLTSSEKPESHPRWSPEGRYLAFLSARGGKKTQVWLLDRRGGDAFKVTDFQSSVSDLAWSPDGKRLALVVRDVDPNDPEILAKKEGKKPEDIPPHPLVITRLQFKRDTVGFLNELRNHIYVFDLATRRSTQITRGPYDDSSPVWSPDGTRLAFVSNRTPEPDSNFNTDIFLVEAAADRSPLAVTHSAGEDGSPAFSPDGRRLAYISGGPPKDIWYATNNLAVVKLPEEFASSFSPEPRILTPGLDRNLSHPRFSADGSSILFLLEDEGSTHLAEIPAQGGTLKRLVQGERDTDAFSVGPKGEIAVLETDFHNPDEIYSVKGDQLQAVTSFNKNFLKGIRLGRVERFRAKSQDGTMIDGFLTLPPDATAGKRLPTVLRIHGGPVSQFSTRFSFEWQILAAHGLAVVSCNPRGSSGRGRDFSYAIWADWGHKDFQDVMAAVDHVIGMGIADPDRLGVGGWSYGGILTDHVITQTNRFKAAISGASEVNYTANYGHDHYQREWEAELGLPWRNRKLWIRLSPFFRADSIKTPTLVMGGSQDWNVPLQNSEQLYEALRRLGVPTMLVVYPGESHGLRRPSFIRDRYQRYIAWYRHYLMPESGEPATPVQAAAR